ncbi:glutamate receptor ionotropic, delta-2-like isoform X2 [Symsagittifera roscoffensis]
MGVVLEGHVINEDLLHDSFTRVAKDFKGLRLDKKIIRSNLYDTYGIIRQVCHEMKVSHVGFLVSMTTCTTYSALASLADEKNIIHIALDSDRCPKYDTQPNPISQFSFPFRINTTDTVDTILAEVIRAEQWPNVVLLYDETFARKRALNIKQRIQDYSKDIRFHEVKMFFQTGDHRKTSASSQVDFLGRRFDDIIEDGEFFNFIILACRVNTGKILALAEQRQVKGKAYNWIVANQELRTSDLKIKRNETRTLLISRKRRYVTDFDTEEPYPPTSTVWPLDRSIEYFEDVFRLFAMTVNATGNKINFGELQAVSCFDPDDYITTFRSGRKLSLVLRQTSSFAGATGFIELNARTNSFIDHLSLNLFRSSYPIGRSDNSASQSRSWNRSSANRNAGASTLTWQLVGRKWYGYALNLSTEKPFEVSFKNLADATLRIVTIEEHPFVIKKVSQDGKVHYEGCCIDILRAIQKDLKEETFRYEIYEVADNQYGTLDNQGSGGGGGGRWTGLVGDVLYKRADMAVAGMIRNYDRELVVDFTASYMDYGVSILIPRPKKTTSIFGFLEPLTVQVWICISVATFGVGLMLFVLSRLSPFSRFNILGTDEFSFNNSMWFALASLMQQGGDATPLSISGRILGTFWWFFTLIIIATYTANLAAFLTVTRMETPIESLEDLAEQTKVPYGTVSPSSLAEFFRSQASVDSLYEKIWNYMDSAEPSPMVKDEVEGFNRVLEGNYAFLWDDPVLQYQRKLHCQHLTTVGKPFNRKNYAFAVPKGTAFLETITMSILRLQESGELDKIKQKWFEGETTCSDDDSIGSGKEAEGIAIKNVAGVFYILGMGAGLSFFTAVVELLWHKYLTAAAATANSATNTEARKG